MNFTFPIKPNVKRPEKKVESGWYWPKHRPAHVGNSKDIPKPVPKKEDK